MLDLLKNYSIEEIIIFIVLLALAVKEVINFFDWASSRIKTKYTKQSVEEKTITEVKTQIKELSTQLETYVNSLNNYIEEGHRSQQELQNSIVLLMESDKDDIKSWITEKHHYFCYEKGYIDDYSLDCIEKRFKHYKDEGGNSFVEDLMDDLRHLPKVIQKEKNK